MDIEEFNKFYTRKNTVFWSTLAAIIATIVAIIFVVMEQKIPSSTEDGLNWFQDNVPIFKEASILIASVLITSLLSTFLIEMKEKNKLFLDIINGDLLTSEGLYRVLPEDKRELLLDSMQNEMYFSNVIEKQNMHKSILKKLGVFPIDFYFESCRNVVKCKIKKDVIEKTIVKTIRLRSYNEPHTIKDYCFAKSAMRTIEGRDDIYEFVRAKIDGRPIPRRDILENKPYISEEISDIRANYDCIFSYTYKKDINLCKDKSTLIEVEYKTVVPSNDLAFVCRTSRPCKNFEVEYTVIQSELPYKLAGYAFGFMDEAPKEAVDHQDTKRITFDEWIFENDGVIIYIEK